MKSKLTKIRKILGEKAKSIINHFGLYSSFNLFYENTKSKTKNSDFPEQVEKIANGFHDFISCLLYTSPSPRDRTRSRMPSSA